MHVCILLITVINCNSSAFFPVLLHTLSLARSVFIEMALLLFHMILGVDQSQTLVFPDTGMETESRAWLATGIDKSGTEICRMLSRLAHSTIFQHLLSFAMEFGMLSFPR